MDTYRSGILSLLFEHYEPNKDLVLSMLQKFHSIVLILSEAYILLTREKAIPALEEIPEAEKKALWDQSAGMRDRVKWCRAVHFLRSI